MNVLILGSGGREHALARRMTQDPSVKHVHVWPGNPGMPDDKILCLDLSWNRNNFFQVIKELAINFVMPGAEQFLYEGVSDWAREASIPCFGPGQEASQLESSKLFSKKFMEEAGIPTSHFDDLTPYLDQPEKTQTILLNYIKPVIKISGPSLGKGVFVCSNSQEAQTILSELQKNPLPGMEDGIFVEEGVQGKEVSVFYACHGENFSYLGSAQDYKRLLDQDQGPNTGGMGTVSPVPWVDHSFLAKIEKGVLLPTLKGMKSRNMPFTGILFLGIMAQDQELNVLEYNVRFGDPETQVLLPLIEGDFTQGLSLLLSGNTHSFGRKKESAVHVVKSAKGYPGLFGEKVEKGQGITLSENIPGTVVYFAGVKKIEDQLVTSGGRVLGITAIAKDLDHALESVYESLSQAQFEGEHFRKDIGKNL